MSQYYNPNPPSSLVESKDYGKARHEENLYNNGAGKVQLNQLVQKLHKFKTKDKDKSPEM